MFNPKITEGEWEIDNSYYRFENGKAVAAVPELLEVYRAARKVEGLAMVWEEDKHIVDGILDAIKKLEDRHCD